MPALTINSKLPRKVVSALNGTQAALVGAVERMNADELRALDDISATIAARMAYWSKYAACKGAGMSEAAASDAAIKCQRATRKALGFAYP